MNVVIAFFTSFIFALGLGIAGMTKPSKVTGFLDLAGAWDPSLAFVMIGGVAIYALFYPLVVKRAKPVCDVKFYLPPSSAKIDRRLLLGSAIFGIGWGLAGYCPGPSLTALANGAASTTGFVVAMVFGMGMFEVYDRHRTWLFRFFSSKRPTKLGDSLEIES